MRVVPPQSRLRVNLVRVAAVCCLTLGSAKAFASKPVSVPDWIHAAAAQAPGIYSPDTRAVVLLDEIKLVVGADGRTVEHHRHIVKILRPGGRDEATVVVPFDRDTKILALHVWSIGPDGHEYAIKDNEVAEVGYPGGGNFYDDERYKVVNPPGRDPGGVVAYEYEQMGRSYFKEATWSFQGDLPRVQQSFTLELPPGYTFDAVWAHHAEGKVIDLEKQRFRWEMNSTPAIDLDRIPMHPSLPALAGRMTVHYAAPGESAALLASWKGIGEWYEQLSHDRTIATPEIAAKAAELTAGKTDFYDKAEAIAEFVQKQVRYFVIEMGIGGWQPHPAGDIFRNRYGDCKDKATLLSAMLSSVGIHSALMLVDSRRGVVDPDAPAAYANHMIGAIEIPAGYQSPRLRSTIVAKSNRRYLIFDPTWEKTAFGQLEHNLQGGYGVLFEGKDTQVVKLPVLDPAFNSVHRAANLRLLADGSISGSIVETRFGDLSESNRESFLTSDAKQQRVEMNRSLSRDFSSFTVSEVKVENAATLNKDFTTSFHLEAERYGRNLGQLLMVRPRVLGSEDLTFDRKLRQVPLDLEETMIEKDDFTIEIPEDFTVDELPAAVKLDVGFAAYESSSQFTGKSLHYTRTYTVREVTVPANRYTDFQKFAAAIGADEQNNAVLKKK